ncbi:MAG: aldehyde dehydrogenase family protein [Alphaproteobacteria bacterium]|nr:aldehyde dehydrogenase family protein [Alphaproteobacteria bacterium]
MTAIVRELLAGKRRETGAADLMLQTAEWAAAAFAGMNRGAVEAIVRAAADAGFAHAGRLAEAAVKETGFGVAADKKIKNELCSRGIHEAYRDRDYCGKRVRAEDKIVEIPRPAGVVFALTPSTNPVCTVYFKVLLALMTRNAIIVSPHPLAKACSTEAARVMAAAAEQAGAPAGVVQVIEEPNLALVDYVMRSPRVGVILATGGTPMVRAAYGSGTPAIGVGPGNAPVLVDASADVEAAARRIIDSKSFDNSVLCTNESVVIAEEAIYDKLSTALGRAGAYFAKTDEVDRLRAVLFDGGSFNVALLGRSAATIAQTAGFRVPAATRVLIAPLDRVGVDEPLSREKLCPVLGLVRVPQVNSGIATARALVRLSGAGHSAAIHSRNPANIMAFAAAVKVLRVVVNSSCSQGAAGFSTHLAPTFTIGTGFFGRSSVGENIGPDQLVNWTRIAYDTAEPLGDFSGLEPWSRLLPAATGREAPISLGVLQEGAVKATPAVPDELSVVRDEIRRVVLEELRRALKG